MTTAAGDAKAIAIYGALQRILAPIYNTSGALFSGGLTGLAATRSIDEATAASTTNSPVEIATDSGVCYLDLTAAEMSCNCLMVTITATNSNAVPSVAILYPQQLPIILSGTAQGGSSTTVTLPVTAATINGFYCGCYVQATNNTPTGIQYQTRKIIGYVGSTTVATVDSPWGNNPTSSTTIAVLLPPVPQVIGANLVATLGAASPAQAGSVSVDWDQTVNPGSTVDLSGTEIGAVNVTGINGNSTAAANLQAMFSGGMFSGTVTAASSGSSFTGSTNLPATANFFGDSSEGAFVLFTSGANAGQSQRVNSYTSGRVIGTANPFTATPSNGDAFLIVGCASN